MISLHIKEILITNLNGIAKSVAVNKNSLSDHKGTKLILILQTNSSKVVDENEEHKTVYHGTRGEWWTFDKEKSP